MEILNPGQAWLLGEDLAKVHFALSKGSLDNRFRQLPDKCYAKIPSSGQGQIRQRLELRSHNEIAVINEGQQKVHKEHEKDQTLIRLWRIERVKNIRLTQHKESQDLKVISQ